MTGLRFEEHFKKELKSRTINPSSKSWETLRSRLDSDDKRKTALYWWGGIAASFVAGLLLFNVFKNPAEPIQTPVVTEQNEQQNIEGPISVPPVEATRSADIVPKTQRAYRLAKTEVPPATAETKTPGTVAEEPIPEKSVVIEEPVPVLPNADSVPARDSRGGKNEIDALLARAEEKIAAESREQPAERVSARDVLADVEYDLDQSFKEKVFETLKDGFLKTREAFVSRNE